MLKIIPESFRSYPLAEQEVPTPMEWSDLLREKPEYVSALHMPAALEIASDRQIFEELPEPYQKLGGTLIRVMFTDQQLFSIHNNER